jgi:hypothetical protein
MMLRGISRAPGERVLWRGDQTSTQRRICELALHLLV